MKHIVISGANRGIGLELAKQLTQQGAHMTAICRQASVELEQLNCQVISNIDLRSEAQIRTLAEKIQQPIDCLINNAGVSSNETLGNLSSNNLEQLMFVNAIAPLLVTETLLPRIQTGGQIAMITSRMGSMTDNTSGRRYAYRMSKAALNAATKSLAIDLKEKDIHVALIHPGHVATDMGGPQGIPIHEAATNILARLDTLDADNSGVFYHANGDVLPW